MMTTVRISGWITVALLGALVVSGVWLGWFYEPNAALAWDDIESLQAQISFGEDVQLLHRALIVPTAIFGIVWVVSAWLARTGSGHRPPSLILLSSVLVLVAIAAVSTLLAPLGLAEVRLVRHHRHQRDGLRIGPVRS